MEANKPQTLSELAVSYLQFRKGLAKATIWWTMKAFKTLIIIAGDIRPEELTEGQVETFQMELLNQGKRPATVNTYLRSLRPAFRWAQRRRWTGDPFIEIHQLKVPKQKNNVLEPVDIQRLLNAAPNKRWRLRILLAITVGLRRGEILNLTVADIDFANSRLYVQSKKETATTWQWQPKDKDLRILPIVDEATRCLLEILDDLPVNVPYLSLETERYLYLMNRKPLPENIRICPENNFNRIFRKICRLADVQGKTFHDLRRTCITQWLEGGIQPHEAMELAGHSKVETTLHYYSVTREALFSKAAKVSTSAIAKA